MGWTITVFFDGKVFRPVEPVDLEPSRCYRVTIDHVVADAAPVGPPWSIARILERATDLGLPSDFAAQQTTICTARPSGEPCCAVDVQTYDMRQAACRNGEAAREAGDVAEGYSS